MNHERHEEQLLEQLAALQDAHGLAAGSRRMVWPPSPEDPYQPSPLAAKALADADSTEPGAIARAQPQPLSGSRPPVTPPPLIPRPRPPIQLLSVALSLVGLRALTRRTDPKDTR